MIAVRLLLEGAVVREAVFSALPVSIGRGGDCDFAIFDPSVSRSHARVVADESGAVWIEDAGSINGLRVGTNGVDRAAMPATGALRCSLGAAEVELALASEDATLRIATPRPATPASEGALRATAYWAAGIGAWTVNALLDAGFWSPWEQDRQTKLSWLALGVAVGLPIAAFVLMGLLRIVGRKARIGDVLRALALVSAGWVVFTLVEGVTVYVLSVRVHSLLVGPHGERRPRRERGVPRERRASRSAPALLPRLGRGDDRASRRRRRRRAPGRAAGGHSAARLRRFRADSRV